MKQKSTRHTGGISKLMGWSQYVTGHLRTKSYHRSHQVTMQRNCEMTCIAARWRNEDRQTTLCRRRAHLARKKSNTCSAQIYSLSFHFRRIEASNSVNCKCVAVALSTVNYCLIRRITRLMSPLFKLLSDCTMSK